MQYTEEWNCTKYNVLITRKPKMYIRKRKWKMENPELQKVWLQKGESGMPFQRNWKFDKEDEKELKKKWVQDKKLPAGLRILGCNSDICGNG